MATANFNQQGNRPHQQGGGQSQRQDRYQAPSTIGNKTFEEWKPLIQNWITNGISKETIIYADGMGKKLKEEGLTTSQIRNVFGEMRKIQMNGFEGEKASFLLLRPKLAYAVKRQNAKGMEAFYDLFCVAYDAVDTDNAQAASKQFDQLLQIMEAVLAYHKYHGGQ